MALPSPKYDLTDIYVFSLDEKVPFRPLLVKEERLLQSPDSPRDVVLKYISESITNCSLGRVDGTTLPIFDLQSIWIALTKLSKVEMPDWLITCMECATVNTVSLELDDFRIVYDETHAPRFLLKDDLIVTMRYPTAGEIMESTKVEEYVEFYDMASICIESVEHDGEVITDISIEEKVEFIDNLTKREFEGIRLFFATIPVVQNAIKFDCVECETENAAIMNGYFGDAEYGE